MTTPKLKTATQTAPATRKAGIDAAKAAPKGSKIAAMAKAHATTPARKAPATTEQVTEQGKRIGAMHALITGLNTRVEALETQTALNESRIVEAFENMTKVIASLQLTLAKVTNTVAATPCSHDVPATPTAALYEKQVPAKKARKEAPANSERGTYDGPAIDGPADDVLSYLAECVIANAEAGFLNENVAKASPTSYRRYLRTAQNKAFKACREAHDLTLTQLDDAFTALFT